MSRTERQVSQVSTWNDKNGMTSIACQFWNDKNGMSSIACQHME